MDSIYDPAEVYDAELLDDDIDSKSDVDNGESINIGDGSMSHQDASGNKLMLTDSAEDTVMADDDAPNGISTNAIEEDADENKERFSRTEGENTKTSVMQRLSPSIDGKSSRDSTRGGKSTGNYSRLIVLNLPLSCDVDQLREFINSKLNSGVTLEKLEGIYVGAAMVWIQPVSAIGEVASSLQDCVLDDRKVVARKMSSRDYDIFSRKQKKANAISRSNPRSRDDRAPLNGFWRAALRNINTSLNSGQLESIFRKRAEGIVKFQMISDKSGGNKKHSGRGFVTFESREMASRFCREVNNTIVGGRNVVARLETRPVRSSRKESPDSSLTDAKPASKAAPKPAPRPPHYRLTVTGVSVEVSAKELEEIFSSEVSSPVRAHLSPAEGAPHAGTGYLEFRKEEAAFTAHTLLNGTDIGGSCITLTLDIDKGSEPDQEEKEEEVAEGDCSDMMEVSTQEPAPEEEKRPLDQRSRSRDSDSRRERDERSRKDEKDHRDVERERRDQERERRRSRDNDRAPRLRSRSPLRSDRGGDRGGDSRRSEGVTIYRNREEMSRKTRGYRFRAYVSNIAFQTTESMMISKVNQKVSGLEGVLSLRKDGKFTGVMLLEFASPTAAQNCMDKMAHFTFFNRKIVVKRDNPRSLPDGEPGSSRGRRDSPPRSRDIRTRHRDMSPMMPHHSHMGPDHMMRPEMPLAPLMHGNLGLPSQMSGMNQMMPAMDFGMNPALGMAGGRPMGGPSFGLGQQITEDFGMNRPHGGVSARLGEMMPPRPSPMNQATGFMSAQQQQPPQRPPPPVVVVQETSQRQLVDLPSTTGDANTETYGLSTAFLTSLNIKLPLVKELLVTNLDSAATEADVKDLFSIAGTVAKIQYNKVKGQAIVEMAHPVEAVQAVSMLHNQEYFDRVLGVRLLRPNDPDNLVTRAVVPAVPRGLKTIGKGLGIDGLPLSTTAVQAPVVPPPQQPRHPPHSVIPDPRMQRPPSSNNASADQPLFAFPPPSQLNMQNARPHRGLEEGASTQDRDVNPLNTGRKTQKKAERSSRWERQNSYRKPALADSWDNRRDSNDVDRDRQDGSNSSKTRFRDSRGDERYGQQSTDRVTDLPPQHYGSVDSNRSNEPRGRNESLGGEMSKGFGGGGRQDDQFNKTKNMWQGDRTHFESSSYGNQSETRQFSNDASSNGARDLMRGTWVAGRSTDAKPASSYGSDEQNRNYTSNNQNRDYGYSKQSGGYSNSGSESVSAAKSNFSDASSSIASGRRGSSILGGYAPVSRGGGFGSEPAASGAPSSSLRPALPDISSSSIGREVILSNLPSNAREQTIVDMCLPYGVVRNVVLNSAQRSGRVLFNSYQQATMAADILNNQNYNGAILSAMLA